MFMLHSKGANSEVRRKQTIWYTVFPEIPFRCENWEQMVKHMACSMFLKAVVSLIHAEKVKVGLGYEKT